MEANRSRKSWIWEEFANRSLEMLLVLCVPGVMSIHKIQQIFLNIIQFFDKIKLIQYPQVRNSMTQLTLVGNPVVIEWYQSRFYLLWCTIQLTTMDIIEYRLIEWDLIASKCIKISRDKCSFLCKLIWSVWDTNLKGILSK